MKRGFGLKSLAVGAVVALTLTACSSSSDDTAADETAEVTAEETMAEVEAEESAAETAGNDRSKPVASAVQTLLAPDLAVQASLARPAIDAGGGEAEALRLRAAEAYQAP